MDDLRSHFYTSVGQLLDQAAIGRLDVRLELFDGNQIEGVPLRSAHREDAELDETGYPRSIKVGGHVVVLERVRQAAILHPDAGSAGPRAT